MWPGSWTRRLRFSNGPSGYTESIGGFSVESQVKYAMAMMERAVVFRRVNDLESAIEGHSEALELVRSLDDPQARHTAALISMNLSNALNDAGNYGPSLKWIDEAITRWEALVEAGEASRRDDLVAALQNRFNKLLKLGMLEEACATADRVLPMFERLVSEEGRDDLAFDMGRLLFAVGLARRNLFRPEEALPYFERGVSLLGTARSGVDLRQIIEHREVLTRMVQELRDLIDVRPADFERWVAKARAKAELAQRLGQMGETTDAQRAVHEAVAIVMQLGRVSGESRFLEDAVRWSIQEGVVAMHARLYPASESAFRLALSLTDRLLKARLRPDLIEDLAKAYLGLASLSKSTARIEEAETIVNEMEARLETLDPKQRVRWSEVADRTVTELRKLRDAN